LLLKTASGQWGCLLRRPATYLHTAWAYEEVAVSVADGRWSMPRGGQLTTLKTNKNEKGAVKTLFKHHKSVWLTGTTWSQFPTQHVQVKHCDTRHCLNSLRADVLWRFVYQGWRTPCRSSWNSQIQDFLQNIAHIC
jgi:hypothetical protein